MKLKVMFFIIFAILLASSVLATPPSPPPCHDVENPDYYTNIIFESETYYFEDWEILNISMCGRLADMIEVMIDYKVPYSQHNLDYFTKVNFVVQNNAIINNLETYKDYQQQIIDFENDEAVQFFINATGAENVKHVVYQTFRLESLPREYFEYNFIENSVVGFSFKNPMLLTNLNKFIPGVLDIPQIKEFKDKKTINFAGFGNNQLTVSQDFTCPTCESYLIYDIAANQPAAYMLSNDAEWKSFSEMVRAHNIINENLLIGDLADCEIGKGEAHSYTELNYYIGPGNPMPITVALTCNGTWKDAFVKLNPDGSYENLQIKLDYSVTPPKAKGRMYLVLFIIVLFIAIIFFIIRILKKR
jgi:hypothetical protein